MNTYASEYKSKLRSAEEIVGMIQDNWYISAGQVAGSPTDLYEKLHLIKGKASGVTLQTSLIQGSYPFLEDDMGDSLRLEAWFYGGAERSMHKLHKASFNPGHLSQIAGRKLTNRTPNMFWGVSAPMDDKGNLNISYGIAYEMEMLRAADIVVLEVNENAPRTMGQNIVNIKDVDFIVESSAPRPILPSAEPQEMDMVIGRYIASLVEDGSTIQLGIGNIPNAVALNFKDKKDLGVHTEMITNSMVDLYEMGVITNSRKTLYNGKMVGTFVFGDNKLYDFVDNNPSVYLLEGHHVNDPFIIAQNDKMVSINTAIQVDLVGQVASETIGTKQYSGTGGQFDTAYGAQRSKGGKSIVALKSTAKKGTVSTIVPAFSAGTVVSLTRNDVDYIVTEYGIAPLRGRNIKERIYNLISIAHPDFRADLEKSAFEFGLI